MIKNFYSKEARKDIYKDIKRATLDGLITNVSTVDDGLILFKGFNIEKFEPPQSCYKYEVLSKVPMTPIDKDSVDHIEKEDRYKPKLHIITKEESSKIIFETIKNPFIEYNNIMNNDKNIELTLLDYINSWNNHVGLYHPYENFIFTTVTSESHELLKNKKYRKFTNKLLKQLKLILKQSNKKKYNIENIKMDYLVFNFKTEQFYSFKDLLLDNLNIKLFENKEIIIEIMLTINIFNTLKNDKPSMYNHRVDFMQDINDLFDDPKVIEKCGYLVSSFNFNAID